MTQTITGLTRYTATYGKVTFSDGMTGTWGRDVDNKLYIIGSRRQSAPQRAVRSPMKLEMLEEHLNAHRLLS